MYFWKRIINKSVRTLIIKLIQNGKPQKALKLTDYLKLTPEKFYYKGICYFETGALESAERHLEKALTLKHDSKNTAQVLAQVYILQKKWESAVKVLSPYKGLTEVERLITIINKSEESRLAYLNYATLLQKAVGMMRSKRYEAAVSHLKNAVCYADEPTDLYNQIGTIYLNCLKDRNKAEEYFSKAYQLSPGNKRIKMNYAKVKLS